MARFRHAKLSMKSQPCVYCTWPGTNKMQLAVVERACHFVFSKRKRQYGMLGRLSSAMGIFTASHNSASHRALAIGA
eukprot:8191337-Alexandrium_andersonii.AAC.1